MIAENKTGIYLKLQLRLSSLSKSTLQQQGKRLALYCNAMLYYLINKVSC